MTKKLSSSFFGDKKFTENYYRLSQSGQLGEQYIINIFAPYTDKIATVTSQDGSLTLLDIFVQFVQGVIQQFKEWQYQKYSSIVEIAAHVFEHSFENWLSKEDSFKYFSEVLVRHSLFRPPHSVCVFNFEQLNKITKFWLNHFDRYYQNYRQCMASSLNQILACHSLPKPAGRQNSISTGKIVNKSDIQALLG